MVVAEIVDDVAEEPPIVDAEITETAASVAAAPASEEAEPKAARKRTSRSAKSPRMGKNREAPAVAKPAKPRARKSARGKTSAAADAS